MANIKDKLNAGKASNKPETTESAEEAKGPTENPNIATGVAGVEVKNADKQAGVQEDTRAEGFYSVHCGKVGKKAWPMNDPFVPETDEETAFCEQLVERGYAEYVEPKK